MKKAILVLFSTIITTIISQAQTVTLSNESFDKDTVISADKVILKKNSKVKILNGKSFTIKTKELYVEGTFIFDGKGNPGANGGSPPPWTSSGPCSYAGPFGSGEVAHNDWENAGGHSNDRGGDGGPGGPGGIIIIELKTISGITGGIDNVKFITSGGDPGYGAEGRLLICGCHSEHQKRGQHGGNGYKGADGKYQVTFIK